MQHPSTAPPSPANERGRDHHKRCCGGFILDSGAAVHATGCAGFICDPRPPGDGGSRFRKRLGEDRAVHLVPGLLGDGSASLISVRQLARRGFTVTFGGDCCSVKERSTGAVVGEGLLQGPSNLSPCMHACSSSSSWSDFCVAEPSPLPR
ncbi:hypothetical protein PVAP13_8KG384500 [Panicum virgatum]|uniref:Uncharacterized protein n=1 Tax=Panicum virgatum TaxID=38727 RepID=A0A8T0PSQ4_PANVG|nr:hypothetical protein PVAP13_8KG384500 [Panicum virgatum]